MIGSDVFGLALLNYYRRIQKGHLLIHNHYGEPEEMPVDYLFRKYDEMPGMEQEALRHCKGSILDLGAAAGVHSLYLQEQGQEVTALDISPGCCEVMKQRGITNVINQDFYQSKGKYDCILMLMNGLGLAGTMKTLPSFLSKLRESLNPGGFVIAETSDISYLYQDMGKPANQYFGELEYRFEYDGKLGEWFPWVYFDKTTLREQCLLNQWNSEVVLEDDDGHFLVCMTPQ